MAISSEDAAAAMVSADRTVRTGLPAELGVATSHRCGQESVLSVCSASFVMRQSWDHPQMVMRIRRFNASDEFQFFPPVPNFFNEGRRRWRHWHESGRVMVSRPSHRR